ncbi:protein sidekick-2 isoform X3 [Nasonia vitripennis]|uniref:Ig-like domain-containing protein n=1 Tax=Nasonia vitripennis TaxID=7425 RepID=A0A7M7QG79_NASVI|nr:protein sidekick-2 isoform X3 [Nasonia vitripennis]
MELCKALVLVVCRRGSFISCYGDDEKLCECSIVYVLLCVFIGKWKKSGSQSTVDGRASLKFLSGILRSRGKREKRPQNIDKELLRMTIYGGKLYKCIFYSIKLRAVSCRVPEIRMRGSSLASVVAGSNKPTRSWDKPYFDDVSPRNVTAVVGQTAELSCHVKHPGDRTISWMRKRDLHILTSSVYTYTGDARFSVSHPETSDEWKLKIAYVQPRDAGIYECQINTEPKLNLAFMLRVEAAQARIKEPEDIYVKKGSTISLTCTVNVQSTPPSSVSWHHGNSVVDFDSPSIHRRGGVSLETEKTESGTTSKLLVTQARISDSGNYTCIPSNANPASVTVHVLNGEHPAAMQHAGTGYSGGTAPKLLLAILTLLLGNLVR